MLVARLRLAGGSGSGCGCVAIRGYDGENWVRVNLEFPARRASLFRGGHCVSSASLPAAAYARDIKLEFALCDRQVILAVDERIVILWTNQSSDQTGDLHRAADSLDPASSAAQRNEQDEGTLARASPLESPQMACPSSSAAYRCSAMCTTWIPKAWTGIGPHPSAWATTKCWCSATTCRFPATAATGSGRVCPAIGSSVPYGRSGTEYWYNGPAVAMTRPEQTRGYSRWMVYRCWPLMSAITSARRSTITANISRRSRPNTLISSASCSVQAA